MNFKPMTFFQAEPGASIPKGSLRNKVIPENPLESKLKIAEEIMRNVLGGGINGDVSQKIGELEKSNGWSKDNQRIAVRKITENLVAKLKEAEFPAKCDDRIAGLKKDFNDALRLISISYQCESGLNDEARSTLLLMADKTEMVHALQALADKQGGRIKPYHVDSKRIAEWIGEDKFEAIPPGDRSVRWVSDVYGDGRAYKLPLSGEAGTTIEFGKQLVRQELLPNAENWQRQSWASELVEFAHLELILGMKEEGKKTLLEAEAALDD